MAKKPVWRETEAFRPYSYIIDHIAKKSHTCRRCKKTIEAKTLYYEKKIMTPSYFFFSEKYCSECYNELYNPKETPMKLSKLPAKTKPFAYIYERKARKAHVCDWCKNSIHIADNYFHKKILTEDRKFIEKRYCDKCFSTANI